MSKLMLLATFIPLVLLNGCAVTGPADDGYDTQNEWVDNGRLLDDDSRTIYSTDKQSGKSVSSAPSEVSEAAEMDAASYQQWSTAKQNDTPEYQKFKQWQEFEAFHRWKQEQNSE